MTQQEKDREAFEAWYREHYREAPLVNQDPAIEEIEYSSVAVRLRYDGWQAARDHYAPKMEVITICGLKPHEIARLQSWFESQNGRTFTSFWEEAFEAGVNQAKVLLAPRLTEKEAMEAAANAIKVAIGNSGSYGGSNPPTYREMAIAALRAAGVWFKEEV